MRKLTLALATFGCIGLVAPAFAASGLSSGQSSAQFSCAESGKNFTDLSAAKKKGKKKSTTSRKSWGGS